MNYSSIKKLGYSIINFLRDKYAGSAEYTENNEKDIIILNSIQEENRIVPKKIWLYWEDQNVPELVLLMVEQIRKVFKEYNVNLLTGGNLTNYLPDLDFSIAIPLANKSDIIRLSLLYRYGGIWIDSSVIISDFPKWLEEHMAAEKYDLIAFYREVATIDFNFPVIESWFLTSPAQNIFIKSWLDELMPLKDLGQEKYFKEIRDREDYSMLKQNIDNPEYLLVYLAMQIALRKNNNYNLFLKKSEASAFLYQEKSSWAPYKGMSNLIIKKMNSNYPSIIKLTKLCRLEVEYLLEHGFLTRHSLFNHIFNIKK